MRPAQIAEKVGNLAPHAATLAPQSGRFKAFFRPGCGLWRNEGVAGIGHARAGSGRHRENAQGCPIAGAAPIQFGPDYGKVIGAPRPPRNHASSRAVAQGANAGTPPSYCRASARDRARVRQMKCAAVRLARFVAPVMWKTELAPPV